MYVTLGHDNIHAHEHRATLVYCVLSRVTLPPLLRGQLSANKQPTLAEISICQRVILSGSSSSHWSASYPSSSLRAK